MTMEYIYAVWLLHEAKKEINKDNIKAVLNSVGIQPNDAIIDALLSSLQGVDLNKVKEEAVSVQAVTVQATSTQQPQQEQKKEEKKEEEQKQQQALEGLGALFGF